MTCGNISHHATKKTIRIRSLLVQECVEQDQLLISSLQQRRNQVPDLDPAYHYTEKKKTTCIVSNKYTVLAYMWILLHVRAHVSWGVNNWKDA